MNPNPESPSARPPPESASASSAPPLLEVRGLQVAASFRDNSGRTRRAEIVRDASFTLKAGRALGLIGESGAGKSTIGLATLAYGRGGCRPVGGQILLEGTDILALDDAGKRALRGARVAYVAQSAAAAFNPAHRLEEQLLELPLARGLCDRRAGRERMISLFKQLGLPDAENFGARFPHQVSGGQLQRAMTAMALMGRPRLVVFDEPTTALDVTTQLDVLAAIKKVIREENTAALYISHDLAVVAQVADDILVLRNGEMVEHSSAADILQNPREDYTRRLLAVRGAMKQEGAQSASPLLEARKVSAAYGAGGDLVLREVSVSLDAGRTLAVVGESGSGKSTLARAIMGLLPPKSGEILLGGKPLPPRLQDLKALANRPGPEDGVAATNADARGFRWGFLRQGIVEGWPSGHAATNTAMSAALAAYYRDDPGIRAAAYGWAAYVSASAALGDQGGTHWMSDVVAGTLIGWAIGDTIGRKFADKNAGDNNGGFSIQPNTRNGGLEFALRF